MNGILTTNLSKNSSLNRFLILASCQIESIPKPSGRHYYFYFSSQSSTSLSSSSSSFLPLLHLSYCEHQQTTSYSSSGFSILYSSSRFPLADILDKKHSSSFHQNNAVLSAVEQSSSTTSNIITLMSSSNENHILINDNDNLISSKLPPSPSIVFPNFSLLSTSLSTIPEKGNQKLNMMLLIGCIIAGIILLIIIYMIVKYCNRDEGTYKIDESNTFPTKSLMNNSENHGNNINKISSPSHHRHQKLLTINEEKIDNSKEWYV